MKKYILSFDLGTSSLRAVLFNEKANIVGYEQRVFSQIYPQKNWVEHNPEEIFNELIAATKTLLKNNKINAKNIAGIGITNQRETTVIWNKNTSKPIYNAIVWQDNRTENYCNSLKINEDMVKAKTGLVINPYFSASKINWILNNVIKNKKEITNLKFGTIDSWILWKLTGSKEHSTDLSNASRTLLFNINTLKWDDELLKLFQIPKNILPEVKASNSFFGNTEKSIFGSEIPIYAIMGDQQSSLFGQLCFEKDNIKATYGTGCFILKNTGLKPIYSKNGLLTTIAWGLDNKIYYALEASIFNCASIINWLKNNLQIAKSGKEIDKLAASVSNSNDITFISSFYGLSAPHWTNSGNAEILGLTLNSTKAHIVRAALESIVFQVNDAIKIFENDSGKIREISVDGGVANSNLVMQLQSDISKILIKQQIDKEKTAAGVAFMAGLKLGLWNLEFLKNKNDFNIFKPNKNIGLENAQKNWGRQIKKYINKNDSK